MGEVKNRSLRRINCVHSQNGAILSHHKNEGPLSDANFRIDRGLLAKLYQQLSGAAFELGGSVLCLSGQNLLHQLVQDGTAGGAAGDLDDRNSCFNRLWIKKYRYRFGRWHIGV